MKYDFVAVMRRATALTRASQLTAATREIQVALLGQTVPEQGRLQGPAQPSRPQPNVPLLRLVRTGPPESGTPDQRQSPAQQHSETSPPAHVLQPAAARMPRPLGEVLRSLRQAHRQLGAQNSYIHLELRRAHQPALLPDGAQFVSRSFTCAAGTRAYKLYIPASASAQPLGLVVMLHGCKQDPDDFAAGTNMNAIAESHGLAVAYPAQSGSSNAMSCWNWFNPGNQLRDAGEPSIIAGITAEVVAEFNIGFQKVYLAGLSAGGAMAAVMGATYPDLYAAAGIHSGLAFRSADDVVSAFAAMRGEVRPSGNQETSLRTIVFHGTADQTVHPANAATIVEGVRRHYDQTIVRHERGLSPGGRSYTRSIHTSKGAVVAESWLIESGGHAWSGGRAEGSFTDPTGPDASAEMIRFFLN